MKYERKLTENFALGLLITFKIDSRFRIEIYQYCSVDKQSDYLANNLLKHDTLFRRK
jgi:hypothetical protein